MIQIVDLGLNNIWSLVTATREVSGALPEIITHAEEIADPDLLILPGTGAFGPAVEVLESRGFKDALGSWSLEKKGRILGVCLGMHLLFQTSEEAPAATGLGLITGHVTHLSKIVSSEERVPHVGWSQVSWEAKDSDAWHLIDSGRDFYFSHSYAVKRLTEDAVQVMTTTIGNRRFVSGVRKGNIFGVQFHPEKSSFSGLKVLASLVEKGNRNA